LNLFYFFIYSILLLHLSCDTENKNSLKFNPDSSYAVFKLDSSNSWLFKNASAASLSVTEINVLDSLVNVGIEQYNKERKIWLDSILQTNSDININLEELTIKIDLYKKQYLPFINSNGEKEVWVNCLCDGNDENWKKEIQFIQDGGKCYFNLMVNLSTRVTYAFMVNGNA